jgi:anti-anti-sigma regulatory factor
VTLDSRAGRAQTSRVLRWQLQEVEGRTTVELVGILDENADLQPLADLCGEVAIDLSGVRRISSTGVREWIDLMRALDGRCQVALVACSPASVTQLNLISNFRGAAQVESFLAPYQCACCGVEHDVLLDADAATRWFARTPTLPAMPCTRCDSVMELAEIPERYLTFLMDQDRPAITA